MIKTAIVAHLGISGSRQPSDTKDKLPISSRYKDLTWALTLFAWAGKLWHLVWV